MHNNQIGRIIFLTALFAVLFWMILSPDRTTSERENRSLRQFPEITFESVTSGRFMSEFETYLTDQFPVRDECMELKSNSESLMGDRKVADVYIGSDDYLIQEESSYQEEKVVGLVQAINDYAARNPEQKCTLMLVPNAVSILEDHLPYGVVGNQDHTIALVASHLENCGLLDMSPVFRELAKEGEEQLYYRTDHHWTTDAAYHALTAYEAQMGVTVSRQDFLFLKVSEHFQGTLATNSGIFAAEDTVKILIPPDPENLYVANYVNETEKRSTIFERKALEGKDKYQVFFGGNYAQINITTNAGTGRSILIIKDSYANCMIPAMTNLYDRITVVDPRYYYGDIDFLTDTGNYDEVLFLYNVNTFVTDISLEDVLEK